MTHLAKSKTGKDYSILGPENDRALEKGLANAQWYATSIPRNRLKELMKRKDGPALRDTAIWIAALLVVGYAAYRSWGSYWAIPAFILYGVIYTTHAVSKWHETCHGTAFKTPWMNEAMYQICSFMIFIQATNYRWTHVRHHTDTIIVGRDPEIYSPRPPVWRSLLLEFLFRLASTPRRIKTVFMHMAGRMTQEEQRLIPKKQHRKLYMEARVFVLLYAGLITWCVEQQSILPAMFIGLPLFYGFFLTVLLTVTQHLGLHENVLDHRLNTRTFYTNRLLRFLYSNMNYHLEHHMFPMVPYHALPALHEEIKHDCPAANKSFIAALKEALGAMWRQRDDPEYTAARILPDTAASFKYGPS